MAALAGCISLTKVSPARCSSTSRSLPGPNLGEVVDGLVVVRHYADEGEELLDNPNDDLGVEEGHPFQNVGVFLFILSE